MTVKLSEIELDKVLKYLYEDRNSVVDCRQTREKTGFGNDQKSFDLVLNKLEQDKHATLKWLKSTDEHPATCRITYHGQLFYERGGYHQETIRLKKGSCWTTTKTSAAVLYSILVLVVAAWGVLATCNSNKKDNEIKELQHQPLQ